MKLRARYGAAGYGIYWYCLELIAREVDKNNLTFELEHDAELLAIQFGMHADTVQEMMRYMCELELFENSGGVITCLKMAAMVDEYTTKLINSRQTPDTIGTNSALIEKKRTEKNKKPLQAKPAKRERFKAPTVDEVRAYLYEKNYPDFADAFVAHYESNGWRVGKNPMKSWKAATTTWAQKRKGEEQHTLSFEAVRV